MKFLQYRNISLQGADTITLDTIIAVKHLLLSGHLVLFLQLHPWLLEVG